jgi:3-deoxy-D-manno-octulosonic-acid transferase
MTPGAYRALTTLAAPLIRLYLRRRMMAGKEDTARFEERLGRPGRARPNGPLAWLHAASVGEAQSVLLLLERLLAERPWLQVMVTTGTVTSADFLGSRLPERAFHQYVPVDRLPWVRRFLDHWRPDLALWVESELWPNLVRETQVRGVPMVLLNGRMSAKSFAGWQRAPSLVRPLLDGFTLCFAQSHAEAERFGKLGAGPVRCIGNLKLAAHALAADELALAELRRALGVRPVWLAASTHPGEEWIVAEVHARLAPDHPGLLTILVPRHPSRGAEIARGIEEIGVTVARRGAGEFPSQHAGIYLADTMGELGLFYRLAPIAFMGGSLVLHGGQNLVEPARLGCAVLHGPHMWNFSEVVDEMTALGALVEVEDGAGLAAGVARLLGDPEQRARQAAAGRGVAEAGGGIIETLLGELAPHLDPLEPRAAGAAARARA